jgi:hypothetical protein
LRDEIGASEQQVIQAIWVSAELGASGAQPLCLDLHVRAVGAPRIETSPDHEAVHYFA